MLLTIIYVLLVSNAHMNLAVGVARLFVVDAIFLIVNISYFRLLLIHCQRWRKREILRARGWSQLNGVKSKDNLPENMELMAEKHGACTIIRAFSLLDLKFGYQVCHQQKFYFLKLMFLRFFNQFLKLQFELSDKIFIMNPPDIQSFY